MRPSGKRCRKCLWMANFTKGNLLGSSLKSTKDETLFLELALRGYDLSRLRDDTEPDTPPAEAEIVKIG